MKKNKKWESLAGIIIWIFILSFVILWIWSLIWTSRDLIKEYDIKTQLDFLTNSSYNIIDKLDVSFIPDEKVFYLYKNKSANLLEIKVWETYSEYKYVNKFWEKIDDPSNYKKDLFLRFFYVKKFIKDWKEKIAIKWIIKELTK
jgi:hypothetical protein